MARDGDSSIFYRWKRIYRTYSSEALAAEIAKLIAAIDEQGDFNSTSDGGGSATADLNRMETKLDAALQVQGGGEGTTYTRVAIPGYGAL